MTAIADVLAWHQPAAVRRRAPGSVQHCKECGFAWPCRTYTRLSELEVTT